MSDQPAINDERVRAIERRANGGEYHCREHFAQLDADDDVLFLLAIIARFRGESAQLAATHAAIRALPRLLQRVTDLAGNSDIKELVEWDALTRLLGGPDKP